MKKANNKYLYRVLSKGGIISTSMFTEVLKLAENEGNKYVMLGSRQDMLFYLSKNSLPKIETTAIPIQSRNSGIQNVVSSFVCVDILPSTNWVYSGIFIKIADQFTYNHQLRVNIVDPLQNMVPLFYGELNFIASEIPNFWHMYLNLEETHQPKAWPGLIFTEDIALYAKTLEKLILEEGIRTMEALHQSVASSDLQKNTLDKNPKLTLSKGSSPYYEGLEKMENKNKYWAGFYWRNNQYPIQFLKDVCELCMKTNIGKISFTPWKTFLIKDIETKDKIYWDDLIGRYGINMRHSSFELNWHLPLLDKEAAKLKRFLVAEFDKFDIRTYSLSFAIQNKSNGNFTSVVIHKNGRLPILGRFDFTASYSIDHAYDFNPNSNFYMQYERALSKQDLPKALNELSKRYNNQQFVKKSKDIAREQKPVKNSRLTTVYQCPQCKTVYDERFGDILAEIAAGTTFNNLHEDYCCQVCESPKSTFKTVEIEETTSV